MHLNPFSPHTLISPIELHRIANKDRMEMEFRSHRREESMESAEGDPLYCFRSDRRVASRALYQMETVSIKLTRRLLMEYITLKTSFFLRTRVQSHPVLGNNERNNYMLQQTRSRRQMNESNVPSGARLLFFPWCFSLLCLRKFDCVEYVLTQAAQKGRIWEFEVGISRKWIFRPVIHHSSRGRRGGFL